MVVNVTKTSQKMKNRSPLIMEKIIIERGKTLCYNYRKIFRFKKAVQVSS